ncbi:MAG: DsbC family protein [Cellvibrionaceae bacterium]
MKSPVLKVLPLLAVPAIALYLGFSSVANSDSAVAKETPDQAAVIPNSPASQVLSPDVIAAIKAGLEKGKPPGAPAVTDLTFDQFKATPLPGIYQVSIEGQRAYTDKNARFFVMGELHEVLPGQGFRNLVELERTADRKARMAAVPVETMITYAPEGEVKGRINVFTDVNCGYCRKFHQNILPELNKMGIAVSYYAFPVIGREVSRKQMISAWCSKDREMALTTLKERKPIDEQTCSTHPVDIHLELGRDMEVGGTPSVFLPSGDKVQLGRALIPSLKHAFGIN